jgi:hypothetical protein
MSEWLGLIGALGGTLIGSLVTYIVANQHHKHERQLENEKRLVVAYESIHELLSLTALQVSSINIGITNRLGFNPPLKKEPPLKKDFLEGDMHHLNRLSRLVDFYVPFLRVDINAIQDQVLAISRCMMETIMEENPTDDWRLKTIETSNIAFITLNKLVQAAQQKLAESFRSVVGQN